eukprot:1623993-Alexandrium_andersonii.AAC.1
MTWRWTSSPIGPLLFRSRIGGRGTHRPSWPGGATCRLMNSPWRSVRCSPIPATAPSPRTRTRPVWAGRWPRLRH